MVTIKQLAIIILEEDSIFKKVSEAPEEMKDVRLVGIMKIYNTHI